MDYQKQHSIVSERQRTNSFTYKHKNPISRTSSFDEKSKGRMQSLKTIFYNKEVFVYHKMFLKYLGINKKEPSKPTKR